MLKARKRSILLVVAVGLSTFGLAAVGVGEGVALIVGGFGLYFGWRLWTYGGVSLKLGLLLLGEVACVIVAFALAYAELGLGNWEALKLSIQALFHVDILPAVLGSERRLIVEALTLFQAFVGYVLVVTGLGIYRK